eukprot:CAMPEP_0119406148 /NCGR_PEP_ID=MMETSP1335-20130426/580_1 /TAXON_ID=259385 /ORGANISM="Chrysoculter rhomboideus, Strain RCC1486" /LENGTH=428 /DNA_ID=CAMNT_0007430213 /DNA_START=94 /DNA_END=1380 /DNA_ORIENTATION=-
MNAQRLYKTLEHVVSGIDSNYDGVISLDEFQKVYFKMNPLKEYKEMMATFEEIDKDNSKTITLDELAIHLGFTFKANGKLSEVVETDNMRDEQLLELMRLEAIATDMEKEAAGIKNRERRRSQQLEIERKAQEARERAKLSVFQRTETSRRLSLTSEVTLPLNRHTADVRRHSTKPELELLDACTIGEWELVDKLLLAGVKTNICDDKGETPLHKIARVGGSHAVVVAIELKKRGAEVDYPDKRGKTAAHYAAEYAHADMLDWLISKGADLSLQSLDGWTVLHEACFCGNRKVIELVLKTKQVDIDAKDSHERTALHVASYRCDEPIIELLVEHGADPTLEDDGHHDAANLAKRVGRRDSAVFLQSSIESLKLHEGKHGIDGNRHHVGYTPTDQASGVTGEAAKGVSPNRARRHYVGYHPPAPAAAGS